MKMIYQKKDEYLTPAYVVEAVLPYLKPNSTILCPFDKQESEYVKVLRKAGHQVYHSHLDEEMDFFNYLPSDMDLFQIDYIISNPPFSKKVEVVRHLKILNRPWAMLFGVASCLGSQSFMREFTNYEMGMLLFNHRIKFTDDNVTPPFCLRIY